MSDQLAGPPALPLPIRIGDREVGPGRPCLVIAEAGVNHNGDPALAEQLVAAAAQAGADAVKFQSFRAEGVASRVAPKAAYQQRTTDPHESQQEMLRRLELDAEAHRRLQACCQDHGILFLSSPFDIPSADLLEALGVPAFKLGSGELTNRLLLEHVAAKRKPLLLSTGMAWLGEVEQALRWARNRGAAEVALLHCVSQYPAQAEDTNLRALLTLRRCLQVPVGYSDHTIGPAVPLAAVALGACIVEKHFTLDRTLPGPDHAASCEPRELAELVRAIRTVEAALGDGCKRPAAGELENRSLVRRSLAAACDLPRGTRLDAAQLTALRPGSGIEPALLPQVAGRTLARDVAAGELLSWEDLC